MAALLDRLPSLRSLALSMPAFADFMEKAEPAEVEWKTNVWRRVHGRLAAFAASHPHRAALLVE